MADVAVAAALAVDAIDDRSEEVRFTRVPFASAAASVSVPAAVESVTAVMSTSPFELVMSARGSSG